MNQKRYRTIAGIMAMLSLIFIIIALTHPELSFPWSNTITYLLYAAYLIVMVCFAIAGHRK